MNCPNCGSEIKDTQKFCPYCGTKMNILDNNEKESLSSESDINKNTDNDFFKKIEKYLSDDKFFKRLIIYLVIIVLVICLIIFLIVYISEEITYKNANELFLSKNFQEALTKVESLPKKTKYVNLKNEILFEWAESLFKENKLDLAESKANELPKDISKYVDLRTEIIYERAKSLFEGKKYSEAKSKASLLSNGKKEFVDLKNEINSEIEIDQGDKSFDQKNYKQALEFYKQARYYFSSKKIDSKIQKAETAYNNQIRQLESNIEKYKDEYGNTIYKDKSTIFGTNGMYLYMVKEPNRTPYMKFVISRVDFAPGWHKFSANIDGVASRTFEVTDMDKKETSLLFMTQVIVELDYDRYSDIVSQIMNSRRTIIKLESYIDSYDREIPASEKAAMRHMVEYYYLIK